MMADTRPTALLYDQAANAYRSDASLRDLVGVIGKDIAQHFDRQNLDDAAALAAVAAISAGLLSSVIASIADSDEPCERTSIRQAFGLLFGAAFAKMDGASDSDCKPLDPSAVVRPLL